MYSIHNINQQCSQALEWVHDYSIFFLDNSHQWHHGGFEIFMTIIKFIYMFMAIIEISWLLSIDGTTGYLMFFPLFFVVLYV